MRRGWDAVIAPSASVCCLGGGVVWGGEVY